MAVALVLATARAAESTPSLIGATREQVLARYGEPKSQIAAGNRVILFFANERVVLRDGRVVEVERLPSEPVRRPAPAATPEQPTAPAAAPADRAASTGAAQPAAPASSSTAPAPAPTTTQPASTDPAAKAAPGATEPAPAPAEPKFEIKMVLPSGSPSRAPRPSPPPTVAPTATTPAPATTPPAAAEPTRQPPTIEPTPSATTPATTRATVTTPETTTEVAPSEKTERVATEPAKPTPTETAEPVPAPVPEAKTKAKAVKSSRRAASEPAIPDATESVFTGWNYLIALVIIGGGGGYLFWRSRQRQLALAATAVSNTPFSPATTTGSSGTVFTPELLAKLEWKRFEELVAAYYSKTGVVASRTKSGPDSPVNIKISWKGEPRPFACVKCIAHPAGLIDVKPLQDLVAVLSAEDIRRGYVVTSGKFNVAARDYAEEKHLTLLPGDIFLEKINALPESARMEIMQEAATGDYTTPSCPACDAKMIRSPEDPAMWHCAAHPEQQIPVRK